MTSTPRLPDIRSTGAAVTAIVGEAAKSGVPVQLGGGLRTLADVAAALDAGVSRVVVGTAAAKSPDLAAAMVQRFGAEKIVVSLDAKDGVVATHAWRMQSSYSVQELAAELVDRGVRRFVYTDITHDGTLTAPNNCGDSRVGGSQWSGGNRSGRRDDHRPRAGAGCRRAARVPLLGQHSTRAT